MNLKIYQTIKESERNLREHLRLRTTTTASASANANANATATQNQVRQIGWVLYLLCR